MTSRLAFTDTAAKQLQEIRTAPGLVQVKKQVEKALGYLQINVRHPGLRTHKFNSLRGAGGEDVFEAYAQNRTPGAYRIFWHYGPGNSTITIIAITPHP